MNLVQLARGENHIYKVLPDGRWLVKFDAHMLKDWMTCATYFNISHIPDEVGKVYRRRGGFGWPATFGIWWAHVLEDLYNHLMLAQKKTATFPTLQDLVRYAVKRWQMDNMDQFAVTATKNYDKFCDGFIAYTYESRDMRIPVGVVTLARTYWEYYDRMQDYNNWTVIATESTFGTEGDVVVGESNKVVVAYQGRPDIIVFTKAKQRIEPVDTKTTASLSAQFAGKWKPDGQILGYVVCTQIICDQLKLNTSPIMSAVINGIARDVGPAKPKDGIHLPRTDRLRIEYTQDEIDEWKEQRVIRAEELRYAIEHNKFPRNETACHSFMGDCTHKEVCKQSPTQRQKILDAAYEKVEPWSPKRAD